MTQLQSRTRGAKKDSPSLSINIENFGPVTSAKINLKPLTIFAGSNNSGKSYTAALVHSIIPSQNIQAWLDTLNDHVHYGEGTLSQKGISECVRDLKKIIKNAKSQSIPTNIMKILTNYCSKIIEQGLSSSIIRNFGHNTRDLITIGKSSSSISIHNYDARATIQNKMLRVTIPFPMHLRFDLYIDDTMIHLNVWDDKQDHTVMMHPMEPEPDIDALTRHVIMRMCFYMIRKFTSNIIKRSYYLPASRSGILQAHKTVMSSIFRSISYVGIEDATPKLPGIPADFIATVMDTPKHKGCYWNLAASLETELNGKITRVTDPITHNSEIFYQYKRKKIPLYRTSSSVSELAPLILYLKHVVRKGELVIFEEPESHLDFDTQRILARHIAKMVRAGLYVLVTTHSFFVQEQLNHCLLNENSKASTKLGWGDDEYLLADEVAYYLFDRHENKGESAGGYTAENVAISSKDGIPLKAFDRVIDNMHSDGIILESER